MSVGPIRAALGCACAMLLSSAAVAVRAQEQTDASAQSAWREHYAHARAALIAGRYADAAAEFSALQENADNAQDEQLAGELASIARAELVLHMPDAQPALRTTDELTVLYTTAVFYGLGTAGWLTLQLKPQSFGAALLPFAVLTPAAVGLVALADGYRPLRHGIPHAIAAGLYLGFGEGLWLVAYQHAYATHHDGVKAFRSDRVSTLLWAGSTGGAVVGALIGALRRPTPGRVSFTASTSIWGGLLSAFAAAGIEANGRVRSQTTFLVGTVGYNVGLVAGLLLGPTVAPSVARVRLTDLGALFGAVLGGGSYTLIARPHDSRGSLGFGALGGGLGLALTWWATSGMAPDRSHDALEPALSSRGTWLSSMHPLLQPARGGMVAGVGGVM